MTILLASVIPEPEDEVVMVPIQVPLVMALDSPWAGRKGGKSKTLARVTSIF